MKKSLLIFLLTFFTLGFSQVKYEKGYLINNKNEKSDVLIKNEDWNLNPSKFSYKISEDGKQMTGNITEFREFGVYNFSKYIRFTGNIDQSTDKLNIMNLQKEPEWLEQTVYLKQLVEGKRNLYLYNGEKVFRFFFSEENGPVNQLIYKRYYGDVDKTLAYTNNEFQMQIDRSFESSELRGKIEKVQYKTKSLTDLFKRYNSLQNSTTYVEEEKATFNLYLKPGVSFASAKLNIEEGSPANVDFKSNTGARFGIQLEYILSSNKNKWSIFVEPTYQTYKQTGENFPGNPAEISYSSIEIPVGIRHYFFIDKNSKIFIEGLFNVTDITIGDNYIRYGIPGTSAVKEFTLKSDLSFGGGIGFSYKNKYQISAKFISKDLGKEYSFISVPYSNFSLNAAYNIF